MPKRKRKNSDDPPAQASSSLQSTPSSGNATPELIPTRLQEIAAEIAGKDSELYWALSRVMFLDPKRITLSLEQALKQASDQEKTGNRIRAEVWYRVAGGIALYHGDVESVRKFFAKANSIAGDSRREYKIVAEESEKAVEISRKYYENV